MMCKTLVDREMLVRAGFAPYTASSILRQAKRFMVKQGYEFYAGRRVSVAPLQAVKSVIGDVELSGTEDK